MKTTEKKRKTLGSWLFAISKLLIISGSFLFLFTSVIQIKLIKDDTLAPFVCPGDLCIFLTYRPDYDIGDILLFERDEGPEYGRMSAYLEPGILVNKGEKETPVFVFYRDVLGKLIFLLRRRNF